MAARQAWRSLVTQDLLPTGPLTHVTSGSLQTGGCTCNHPHPLEIVPLLPPHPCLPVQMVLSFNSHFKIIIVSLSSFPKPSQVSPCLDAFSFITPTDVWVILSPCVSFSCGFQVFTNFPFLSYMKSDYIKAKAVYRYKWFNSTA